MPHTTPSTSRKGIARGVLAAVLLAAAGAQPKAPAKPTPAQETEWRAWGERAVEAFKRGDVDEAEKLWIKQLEVGRGGFVACYNLACVRALKGDTPGALERITQAIERGFCDLYELQREPVFAKVRETPEFARLVEIWPTLLDRRIEKDLALAKQDVPSRGTPYAESRDERLRVAYLIGFDEKSNAAARREVQLVARWALAELFPGMDTDDRHPTDAWVTVVLPQRESFQQWLFKEYGPGASGGFSSIGGAYNHDEKRLVSQDLGSTLRHEFMHVLHWRHCVRLGQTHPIWIQEGLCSLVEDFDVHGEGPDAAIEPVESWRTNIAKRREHGGTLLPIEQLATMPREKFQGFRPLANYAMARTLFLYLWREHKLGPWYHAYTEGFATEPSGVAALERVFERPVAQINKDYRAWVRALPEVAEEIAPGKASLGLEVESGDGDGMKVVAIVVPGVHLRPPQVKKGEEGEITVGDSIRTIDGKPVREMAELVRVLSGYQPGAVVELEYRRGKVVGVCRMKLEAKK